jgi:four helix bundle protein
MNDYEKLKVWRDARKLAVDVYALALKFPDDERFGMVSQIQRAAVSVPSNIAEGAGRRTSKDFRRFLDMSAGSANEVEVCALLAHDLGWIDAAEHDALRTQVGNIRRQLHGLSSTLK